MIDSDGGRTSGTESLARGRAGLHHLGGAPEDGGRARRPSRWSGGRGDRRVMVRGLDLGAGPADPLVWFGGGYRTLGDAI